MSRFDHSPDADHCGVFGSGYSEEDKGSFVNALDWSKLASARGRSSSSAVVETVGMILVVGVSSALVIGGL
jgi:hypothetical protein